MKLNGMNVQNAGTNGRNEYLDILEAAWQDHLKPKEPDAPTVISLFAGCGGSSLGYSMAGYRELLAVEWDDNAVATFKLNFPDVPVYHDDIHNLSVDECLGLADLQPGELDILDGSPPCQGFSTAGKRQLDDPRNQLSMEYVRLLRGLKPKVFIMENVSGLVKGKMKLVFAEIMRELKASGYDVKCRLMNTMYFNVPQSRQRLIWIGVREDLGIAVEHPKGKNKPIMTKEAFVNCPSVLSPFEPSSVSQSGRLMRTLGQGQSELMRVRLCDDKPAPTLQANRHAMAGYSHFLHPTLPRGINIGEMKRLQSFSDAFLCLADYNANHQVIGNSVPPLFMKAIAQHVRQEILAEPA